MGKLVKQYTDLIAVLDYLKTKKRDKIEVLYVNKEIAETAVMVRKIKLDAINEFRKEQGK